MTASTSGIEVFINTLKSLVFFQEQEYLTRRFRIRRTESHKGPATARWMAWMVMGFPRSGPASYSGRIRIHPDWIKSLNQSQSLVPPYFEVWWDHGQEWFSACWADFPTPLIWPEEAAWAVYAWPSWYKGFEEF